MKPAPLFNEIVFRKGLTPVNCKNRNSTLNVTDETYKSKHIETLVVMIFGVKLQVLAELGFREKHYPPLQATHLFNHPETWHVHTRVANSNFHSTHPTTLSPLGSEKLALEVV